MDKVYDYKRNYPDLQKPGQAKWLQDDYVKFLRLVEWEIVRSTSGVLGFITNHAWLDNPTFKGMRKHLLESFDQRTVLDLHGNANKKETAPDGSPDENVFEIKQGVAISVLARHPSPVFDEQCVTQRNDLLGVDTFKYCTAPGFLDTRLRYAAWRSSYCSRASSGVRYASFSRRQHWL